MFPQEAYYNCKKPLLSCNFNYFLTLQCLGDGGYQLGLICFVTLALVSLNVVFVEVKEVEYCESNN